jgi:hypothetical protein
LRDVFAATDEAPFLNDQHLQWKYYAERQDWNGSRSFVLSEGSHLMAHACAWPVSVLLRERSVSGFHPIDWAARTAVRGAGTLLLRDMRKLAEFSICMGGTDAAQKVIARSGYRPAGEMKYYARPLRAWRQARTHQRRNWKLPVRFARNWHWTMRRPATAPVNWSVQHVKAAEMPPELLPASSGSLTACARSQALFHYFERCPIARHDLYLVRQDGELRGYFFLSLAAGQARVADAWVNGGERDQWEALYRLAAKIAFDAGDAAEITAASALAVGQRALERCGFRTYQTLPVMIFDPHGLLAAAPPVHWQMIENDFSFLHQGTPGYAT